jgi:energy-coupling factor transporter ATP-binding protein EcfA2
MLLTKKTLGSKGVQSDALFKKNERAGGNNAFGLTDAVLISGGDPQAIAMLLTKKTLGSKGVQSAIAKKLAPEPTVGSPRAILGSVDPKNAVQDVSLPKTNTGIPSVIMGTQNKGAPRTGTIPVQATDAVPLPDDLNLPSKKPFGELNFKTKESTVPVKTGTIPVQATDAKPLPGDLTLPTKEPFGELNFKTKESTVPVKAGTIPVTEGSSKPKSPQSLPEKVSSTLPATILGKSGKAKAAVVDTSSFERAKDLTPEYRGIEDKAFERITKEEDSIIEKYLANPKLSGESRKVVNTDNFRPFFKEDGYAGYNAAAVQEPSSYLSKKAYTKLLKENPEEQVVLLAGGSGSGKTSAVKGLPEIAETMKNSAAVVDSNLSSYESAVAKIKEAQSYGKIPVVDYVYRDPVDSLVEGVVKRMINNADEGGRLVPTKVVAGNHIDSWDVVNKLREDGVGVNFIDNSLGAKKARVSSWEEMTKKIKYPSKKELTDIFNKEIKKLYEQGIIKSKEQFEAYIK